MIQIDDTRCKGCGACVNACQKGAMTLRDGVACVADGRCDECGVCAEACPEGAILLVDVIGPAAPASLPAECLAISVRSAALVPAPSLWPMLGAALGWAGRNIVPRLAWLALDLWDRRAVDNSATMMQPAGGRRSSRGRRHRQRQRRKGVR
jgi:NAD-dependent dihydropyrimidine dehydrogenase PreA subunit